jgi:uncharacterized protein (DUF433 family)
MAKEKKYIEKRGTGFYIRGSRVLLDCVVYQFLEGASPESTLESFPSLTLEQVHGSLAFYLANRAEIDAYLAEGKREFARMAEISRAENPLLFRRLEQAKRGTMPTKQKRRK